MIPLNHKTFTENSIDSDLLVINDPSCSPRWLGIERELSESEVKSISPSLFNYLTSREDPESVYLKKRRDKWYLIARSFSPYKGNKRRLILKDYESYPRITQKALSELARMPNKSNQKLRTKIKRNDFLITEDQKPATSLTEAGAAMFEAVKRYMPILSDDLILELMALIDNERRQMKSN